MPTARAWCLLGALLLGGCAVDETDLANWQHVAQGEKRLGAFLGDQGRPIELRLTAARLLFELGAFDQLTSVFAETTPPDRAILLRFLGDHAVKLLDTGELKAKVQASNLSFYLMSFLSEIPPELADRLVNTSVEFALEHFARDDAPADAQLGPLLLAAGLVRPALVRAQIETYMRTTQDLRTLLKLNELMTRLRDESIQRMLAVVLLDYARRRYPEIPVALADAMVVNRNETLLRFLLDAARDPRVPPATRQVGLDAALKHLKAAGVDGLFRVLKSDDPEQRNLARFRALEMIWDFAGVERLEEALEALPAAASWPTEDGQFKEEVERFCDQRVATKKVAARLVLIKLVGSASWVARAYAMGCIQRLYPEEADQLLAPLRSDRTPLPGWSAEGPTTFADALVSKGG